jgi:hypothetical protein
MSWQHEFIANLESAYTLLLRESDWGLEPLDEQRIKVQGMLENIQRLKQDVLYVFPTKPYDIDPPKTTIYRRGM